MSWIFKEASMSTGCTVDVKKFTEKKVGKQEQETKQNILNYLLCLLDKVVEECLLP